MRRQVKKINRDVEQKKERRPNVETATKPWERTSGNGASVCDSVSSIIVTDWLYWRMKETFAKWSVKQQLAGYTRYMELRLHVGVVNALWVQMGKGSDWEQRGLQGFVRDPNELEHG
jgi:hypothetical protein